MSKRKNRGSAPNLPQETLERARRQAAIDRGEAPEEIEEEVAPVVPEPPKPKPRTTTVTASSAAANPYRTVSASKRRATSDVRGARRGVQAEPRRSRKSELDQDTIAELLDNPTIFVSEDELRRDYHYVVNDLRNMFGLAAGLIVALVVLATLLPR
jgi:hypothetical protein